MLSDYDERGGAEEGILSLSSFRATKIAGQRAILAAGSSAAMRFADGYGEGVELVE